MRKSINILILFFLLILFLCFFLNSSKEKEFKILKIVHADEFYVDFNFNNKIDSNELVMLRDVVAFNSQKSKNTILYSKLLDIKENDYLKLGNLADLWAKNNLENKTFEIKNYKNCSKSSYICKIDLNFNNQDLSQYYLLNGLAHLPFYDRGNEKFKYFNVFQINENINRLINISILKSDNNLAKNLIRFPVSKNTYSKAVYKKFDNIEIYLINPLEYKKPNSDCSSLVCKRVVDEINKASKSIDIAIYSIGDQQKIIEALYKAKARGVNIKIVTNKSKDDDLDINLNIELLKDFSIVFDKNDSLMHNKFFIFDKKLLMSGSANMSPTGFGGYNSNVVVFLADKNIINRYLAEFEQLYNKKFSINKNKIDLRQGYNIYSFFSPIDNILDNVILPEIIKANKSIKLSAFYLTDWRMINALIQAKKRGVEVLIIADATFASSFRDRIDYLRKSGVALIVENWGGKNHEKTLAIDDTILIVGSCNFSKSGFLKNDENVILIKNPKIVSLYSDYFLYLFNSIDKKYLNKIPRAESIYSINSCHDGIDNNFDGKIDSEDIGCKISK